MGKKAVLNITAALIALCALAPVAALAFALPPLDAGSLTPVLNGAIDQAQPTIADWISTGVSSGVMVFLAWLGRSMGIKFIEGMNRAAIATAARNFANYVIDELQVRYLVAAKAGTVPDLTDLVAVGIDYVRGGAGDAIKESRIEADRLRKQVEGALREKGGDLLAKELAKITGLKPVPQV